MIKIPDFLILTPEKIARHREIMEQFYREEREASRKLRGMTNTEHARLHYFNEKYEQKIGKEAFWILQPELTKKLDYCVSSIEEARRLFGKKYREAPMKPGKKNKTKRKKDYIVLPTGRFVPVRICAGSLSGRKGLVTAYGARGYRVTIMSEEKWLGSFRRWLPKEFLQPVGTDLPVIEKGKKHEFDK